MNKQYEALFSDHVSEAAVNYVKQHYNKDDHLSRTELWQDARIAWDDEYAFEMLTALLNHFKQHPEDFNIDKYTDFTFPYLSDSDHLADVMNIVSISDKKYAQHYNKYFSDSPKLSIHLILAALNFFLDHNLVADNSIEALTEAVNHINDVMMQQQLEDFFGLSVSSTEEMEDIQ